MNNQPIRILLVDDDEEDYLITRELFLDVEQGHYRLEWAPNYETGLTKLKDGDFHVCLLDYCLGDRNGIEFIREAKSVCEIPILFLTGQGDREVDMEAMRCGAADYLVKGSFDAQLLDRTIRYTIERTQTLAELRQSQQSLKAANKRLEQSANRINEELDMARIIQRSMLPENFDDLSGLKIAASYFPCETIGGDLYDVLKIDENRIAIIMFDVVGHGVPAALVSAMAKVAFSRCVTKKTSPKNVLKQVNKEIIQDLREQRYLTAFVGFWDNTTKEFTFSRAGHPPAIVARKEERKTEILDLKGISIGFLSNAEYNEKPVGLKSGDKIVIYTDGLTETLNAKGERFGHKRLENLVLEMIDFSAPDLVAAINTSHQSFIGKISPADDITLLVAEIL